MKDTLAALTAAPLELHSRLAEASNGAYLASVDGLSVIYKPIRGERPLWDFPGAVLAHREVASHRVSELLGWDLVPPTVLREGPLGPGMVQEWCEVDQTQAPVDVIAAGPVPQGQLHVFDGFGANEVPVQLVHEDSCALKRMVLFDAVLNNSDRKGGHILAMADGRRLGIDHGLTFHPEPKLRTVLWGWAGQPADPDLLAQVEQVTPQLMDALDDLLPVPEIEATIRRCEALVASGRMPLPAQDWPALPWPPF